MRLDEFLNRRHIAFERLPHQPAYTADRVAQMLHVPGKEMAKTVLLRVGNRYVLAVLPATRRVDMNGLRQRWAGEPVELASEEVIEQLFPDCEPGAIPPFGSCYNLYTIVDESLTKDEQIVFEAQSHCEAFRMRYRDFEALEHPMRATFTETM